MRGRSAAVEPMPRVTVRQRAEVVLSKEEVEHCLRCWLSNNLVPVQAPREKEFSAIDVTFNLTGSDDYSDLQSVILSYEPAREPPPEAAVS